MLQVIYSSWTARDKGDRQIVKGQVLSAKLERENSKLKRKMIEYCEIFLNQLRYGRMEWAG